MKKGKLIIYGFITGIINSYLGACGGIIVVSVLKKTGMSQKEAQANALAVILPLSVLSSAMYLYYGYTDIKSALIFIPGGIIGSLIGTKILPGVSDKALKKVFACFIIWAGIRMIIK